MSGGKTSPRPIRLDNMTLARKEGWNTFVNAAPRARPEPLTAQQLHALGDAARAAYDQARRKWHANLGPIKTPQLAALHEDLWDIVDSNDHDSDKAKGAVAIDAFPGLGKTTSVLAFAKAFQQREIGEAGAFTDEGHERLPVCRVGLTGNTTMKDFNRAMLDFFAHPGVNSGTTSQLSRWALDCVLSCHVKVIIVDDLHFLRWRNANGVEVSNHFKHIANEFPVTLLLIGVGLASKGLFSEGESFADAVLAQTARRTTRLDMQPFMLATQQQRAQWRQMMLAVEQRLVLAEKYPGMLADELSDYLFARCTGHIGSLMTLVNRGCQRAIRTGVERLTIELLDRVRNDEGAEQARRELHTAMEAGKLSSKPTPSRRNKPNRPSNS